MSVRRLADLIRGALHANLHRHPRRSTPDIRHSDQGSQCASTDFRNLFEEEGAMQSMHPTGISMTSLKSSRFSR